MLANGLVAALRALLRDPALDAAFKELVLTLPSETWISEQLDAVDPQRVHEVRESMQRQLARALHDDWVWAWESHQVVGAYRATPVDAGRRALAGLALGMLCLAAVERGEPLWPGRAYQRVKDASNMTDRSNALWALVAAHAELAEPALERFHAMFRHEALVVDKWFAIQAMAPERDGAVFARVRALMSHPDFNMRNPNRARSLVQTFVRDNPAAFHRADGAGYAFWADRVIELDPTNPQLAARLARSMDRWTHLAPPYRDAARAAIERVAAKPALSDDVREVVGRALEAGS
jgi:aminopeptidase N